MLRLRYKWGFTYARVHAWTCAPASAPPPCGSPWRISQWLRRVCRVAGGTKRPLSVWPPTQRCRCLRPRRGLLVGGRELLEFAIVDGPSARPLRKRNDVSLWRGPPRCSAARGDGELEETIVEPLTARVRPRGRPRAPAMRQRTNDAEMCVPHWAWLARTQHTWCGDSVLQPYASGRTFPKRTHTHGRVHVIRSCSI